MFKLAIIFAVFATIKASGYAGGPGYAGPSYGGDYSAPTPYSFGHDVVGGGGAHSRREQGDGAGNVKGSYTLSVADGRKRVVDYVADDNGFRAVVKTNEPGTDSKDPADVKVIATPAYGLHGAYSHGYAGYAAAPGYGGAYGSGRLGAYGGYGPRGGLGLGRFGHGAGRGLGYGAGYGAGYGVGAGYGAGYGVGAGYGAGARYAAGVGAGAGYSRSYSNANNRAGHSY